MTYSKSLQGRFVSSRSVPRILLGVSVLMWLVEFFFDRPINEIHIFGLQIGNVVSRSITFACFALATALMSSWYVFDRRIRWYLALFFCLPSVSFFVHGSLFFSFALNLFIILLYRIFNCKQGEDNRYNLFSALTLFGVSTMLFPQFIMLLLPIVLYLWASALVGWRELLSVLLGLLTPFWFLFGIDYIFPNLLIADRLDIFPIAYITSARLLQPSFHDVFVIVTELLVLIPFVLLFFNSATPGKLLLRKRLTFFALLGFYLILLSVIYSNDFIFYYILSLPVMAVMLTYIFSLNITKFSRYYFIFINIIWLSMGACSLWLRH